MGLTTRLYGCIVENGLLNCDNQNEIYDYNSDIIDNLPQQDSWPPLSRKMFSITDNSDFDNLGISPNYAYNGRIIHFGGNFKMIENEWKEWKVKFEGLLSKLLWLEADVHLQTEFLGMHTFNWKIDLLKYELTRENASQLIPQDFWLFETESKLGK